LARDFAATSKRDSSNQRIETSEEASSISAGFEVEEPVIHVSPRDQFTTDRSSIGRRIPLTLAGLFVAALIGVGATFSGRLTVSRPRSRPSTLPSKRVPPLPATCWCKMRHFRDQRLLVRLHQRPLRPQHLLNWCGSLRPWRKIWPPCGAM
jgi:hypothetical protein